MQVQFKYGKFDFLPTNLTSGCVYCLTDLGKCILPIDLGEEVVNVCFGEGKIDNPPEGLLLFMEMYSDPSLITQENVTKVSDTVDKLLSFGMHSWYIHEPGAGTIRYSLQREILCISLSMRLMDLYAAASDIPAYRYGPGMVLILNMESMQILEHSINEDGDIVETISPNSPKEELIIKLQGCAAINTQMIGAGKASYFLDPYTNETYRIIGGAVLSDGEFVAYRIHYNTYIGQATFTYYPDQEGEEGVYSWYISGATPLIIGDPASPFSEELYEYLGHLVPGTILMEAEGQARMSVAWAQDTMSYDYSIWRGFQVDDPKENLFWTSAIKTNILSPSYSILQDGQGNIRYLYTPTPPLPINIGEGEIDPEFVEDLRHKLYHSQSTSPLVDSIQSPKLLGYNNKTLSAISWKIGGIYEDYGISPAQITFLDTDTMTLINYTLNTDNTVAQETKSIDFGPDWTSWD